MSKTNMTPDDLLEILEGLIPEDETVRLGTIVSAQPDGVSAIVRFDGETTASTRPRLCVGYSPVGGDRVVLLRTGSTWTILGKAGSRGVASGDLPPPQTLGYRHVQTQASTTWTIVHGLGFYPNVEAQDSAGTSIIGRITHTSLNQLALTFANPRSGAAYLS